MSYVHDAAPARPRGTAPLRRGSLVVALASSLVLGGTLMGPAASATESVYPAVAQNPVPAVFRTRDLPAPDVKAIDVAVTQMQAVSAARAAAAAAAAQAAAAQAAAEAAALQAAAEQAAAEKAAAEKAAAQKAAAEKAAAEKAAAQKAAAQKAAAAKAAREKAAVAAASAQRATAVTTSRSTQRAAAPSGSVSSNAIVAEASKYRGVPYVYGGSTPSGFDCSGFTSYVFRQVGISLPRTAAAQYAATTQISAGEARAGDLVFVHTGGRVSHVAIYDGNGRWWEATRPGRPVSLNSPWTSSITYGRVG